MISRSRRPTAEEALRRAYARRDGCPEPQVFLREPWSELPTEEREQIERHAARCPACAAERELARSFDDIDAGGAVRATDVDHVVSRLEALRPADSDPVVGTPRGPRTRRPSSWLADWRLASAAALLVGVVAAAVALRPTAPPLPPPPSGDAVLRGSRVEVTHPAGELDSVPRELAWTEVDGAGAYRVRLIAVDDEVLWETTVNRARVALPGAVTGSMHAAVVYKWTVEALDTSGVRVAISERVSFRVRPEAGPGSPGVGSEGGHLP